MNRLSDVVSISRHRRLVTTPGKVQDNLDTAQYRQVFARGIITAFCRVSPMQRLQRAATK